MIIKIKTRSVKKSILFMVLIISIGLINQCSATKGALKGVTGVDTYSQREVIKLSHERPMVFDDDLYYKGEKVGTVYSFGLLQCSPFNGDCQDVRDKYWYPITQFPDATRRSIYEKICPGDKTFSSFWAADNSNKISHAYEYKDLDGNSQAVIAEFTVPDKTKPCREGESSKTKITTFIDPIKMQGTIAFSDDDDSISDILLKDFETRAGEAMLTVYNGKLMERFPPKKEE